MQRQLLFHCYSLFLYGVLCVFGAPAFAYDQVQDLYVVSDVVVDSRGSDAAEAKKQGLKQAQEDALFVLLKRITPIEFHYHLADLPVDDVASMVRKIEIEDEKITSARYRARVALSFSSEYVNAMLRDNAIPYAASKAPSLLVIPIYYQGKRALLWESDNMWKQAWDVYENASVFIDYQLPLGDLQDLHYNVNDFRSVNYRDVTALLERYGAEDLLVLYAKERDDRVSIEMRMLGLDKEFHHSLTVFKGNADMDEVLHQAVSDVLLKVENRWKAQHQKLAQETLTLAVSVAVGSLSDWLLMKERLDALPFLRRVEVVALAASYVDMHIDYRGSLDSLLVKLNEHHLYLAEEDGKLMLHSSL